MPPRHPQRCLAGWGWAPAQSCMPSVAQVLFGAALHSCLHATLVVSSSQHPLQPPANRRRYSCVAVSANNQVVTPKSNVLDFTTGQAA